MFILYYRYYMQHIRINFHSIISLILCSVIIICSCNFAYATPVSDTATHNILSNIYDRMQYILNVLYNIDSSLYGGAGDTYQSLNLHQVVQQCAILIQAVGSQTADVSSKLVTTNNHLSNISGYTDGIEGSLSTINSNLILYTSHIQSYLHDIVWNSVSSNFFGYTRNIDDTPVLVDSSTYLSPGTTYFYYTLTVSTDSNLYKIQIPIRGYTAYYNDTFGDIHVFTNNHIDITEFSLYEYDSISGCVTLYCYLFAPDNSANRQLIIAIDNIRGAQTSTTYSKSVFCIPRDTKDYYTVAENILLRSLYNDAHDLKELYASDDLINAKNNQQNYEDQVIDDFTGSGSAAASGSDASSLKNISGSLKSGLNSGGSVSGALGVFNDSSDLWKWFSQDNYNDINGHPSRSDNGIIDFYHINQDELQELLNDSNR